MEDELKQKEKALVEKEKSNQDLSEQLCQSEERVRKREEVVDEAARNYSDLTDRLKALREEQDQTDQVNYRKIYGLQQMLLNESQNLELAKATLSFTQQQLAAADEQSLISQKEMEKLKEREACLIQEMNDKCQELDEQREEAELKLCQERAECDALGNALEKMEVDIDRSLQQVECMKRVLKKQEEEATGLLIKIDQDIREAIRKMKEEAPGSLSIILLNFTSGVVQHKVQLAMKSAEADGVEPLPWKAGEKLDGDGDQPVTIHDDSQLGEGLQHFCTERESRSSAQAEGPADGGMTSEQRGCQGKSQSQSCQDQATCEEDPMQVDDPLTTEQRARKRPRTDSPPLEESQM